MVSAFHYQMRLLGLVLLLTGLAPAPASAQMTPAAPQNLQAESRLGIIRFTWDDPGDPSITGYEYRARAGDETHWSPDWTLIPGSNASTTSASSNNVAPGVPILVYFRARNANGPGPASSVTATGTYPPRPQLHLAPATIEEDGGVATVTARMDEVWPEAFTLTVSASAEAPATADDFILTGSLLEFAANATDSTGTVTIAAVDNTDEAADARISVTGTVPHEDVDPPREVTLTIRDDDGDPPPPPPSTGGGGGGGGPPKVEREIPDQEVEALERIEVDISLSFYDSARRPMTYRVSSSDSEILSATVSDQTLSIWGLAPGTASVTVTAANQRGDEASQTFTVTVTGPHRVWLFPRAAPGEREGFARVINHSSGSGTVTVEAIDDQGVRQGSVTLPVPGGSVVHFNSSDLENGNAEKGIAAGVGAGEGDWRLSVTSDVDVEILAYVRTADGLVTPLRALVPVLPGDIWRHRVAIFNPAENPNQRSMLRIVNPGTEDASAKVTGMDDSGASPGAAASIEIPAGTAVTVSSSDLESGSGQSGALGDGSGKWRLQLQSAKPLAVMSLLENPTGHYTNVSAVPQPIGAGAAHPVLLFPSASDASRREGFVRIINRSSSAGEVEIAAFDDSDRSYEPLTMRLEANSVAHFNSDDLELGNAAKGLTGSTGAGEGDWRLRLTSDLEIEVLSYIRTEDGFLTAMHPTAPGGGEGYRVAFFNPGSNVRQASRLRLVNSGEAAASVTISATDDAGVLAAEPLAATIPGGSAREFTAAPPADQETSLESAFGAGSGKWRLLVVSDQPLSVMSLLVSPTGHLSNLSASRSFAESMTDPDSASSGVIRVAAGSAPAGTAAGRN